MRKSKKILTFFVYLITFLSFSFVCAQDSSGIADPGYDVVEVGVPIELPPGEDLGWLDSLLKVIWQFAEQFPVMGTILMIIGFLRLVNKPLFTILHIIVGATPTKKDDEILDNVEKSKFYKWFVYILDWFGSVKLKKK